jgi:chemosensory pili system protein ChpA (sensor histidine kinase/response regulator)
MTSPAPPRRAAYILVVDDDPDVLASLCDALESEGYEVGGAHDGIEALEAISVRRPDLIVTDLLMPTMTGFELLAALHDSPELATIPTLIITAARSAEAQATAGKSVVLPKPLDLDRLLRAVSAYASSDDNQESSQEARNRN